MRKPWPSLPHLAHPAATGCCCAPRGVPARCCCSVCCWCMRCCRPPGRCAPKWSPEQMHSWRVSTPSCPLASLPACAHGFTSYLQLDRICHHDASTGRALSKTLNPKSKKLDPNALPAQHKMETLYEAAGPVPWTDGGPEGGDFKHLGCCVLPGWLYWWTSAGFQGLI